MRTAACGAKWASAGVSAAPTDQILSQSGCSSELAGDCVVAVASAEAGWCNESNVHSV
jgi:hypothetical protein